MKKKIRYGIVLIALFFGFLGHVNAASLTISVNTKSVTTGGKVTVTVNASGLAGKFSITSSNGNILSGGNASIWLENESKSFQFSAKNTGSATITVTPVDVADSNGSPFTTKKSVTINVVKPREKSTNNNLSSLAVEGYSLSPNFNKNTLEYTVHVESNIEKIKINATKEDSYASIEGTGEKEVLEGDNKFEIKVTSETGVSKTYTINVVVEDSNPIVVEVEKENFTVVKRKSSLIPPESFIEKTVTIQETEIPAFYHEKTNITLVGLKNQNGEIAFYRYEEQSNSYQKYEAFFSIQKTIVLEPSEEEIEGYTQKQINVLDKEVTVYQNNHNPDYLLIYGTDLTTGQKGWYSYHPKEESIQTYMKDIVTQMQEDYHSSLQQYKVVLLLMAGISILLLILLVLELIFKNKMKRKYIQKIKSMKQESEKTEKKEQAVEEKKEPEQKLEKDTSNSKEKKSETKKTKSKK